MGQKWYIDEIKAAAAMDDAIKEQEYYYGVELDYMSRNQMLTVVAKLIDVTEGE